jgi:hypothetical protein
VFLALIPSARADTPVEVIPLAVRDGCCECVLPTAHADDKYYLIVGALAPDLGLHRVTIQTGATTDAESILREEPHTDDIWTRRTRALADQLEKARKGQPAPHEYRPSADPPKRKVFYVFVKDRDPFNPDGYVAVTADLRAVGDHCQVYVDHAYADPVALQPTVKDVVATFDKEIYPQACKRLGRALDVDRDGRFTILFTGWLDKLGGGKIKLDGYVRGSDFYRDLDSPHGNRCDMMYLNTRLKPGPYLHTLLAHEFTHAVVFSERVFGDYLPNAPRQDEESWLNEGLAHLNEDAHGYCWDNLDYRISAFLAEPQRFSVVVPDYYNAGLFRSHGHRGATYLFLRWCEDRYGPDLVRKLAQTNQTGVANLETATARRFADLFREWTVSMLLSDSGLQAKGIEPFRRFDLHAPLGARTLAGPCVEEVRLASAKRQAELAGTSAGYFLLHSPEGSRSRVTITADAAADLQVTLIRLPRPMARLTLHWDKNRLILTVHDAAVTLDSVAWERLPVIINHAADTSYRVEQSMDASIRAWFGDPHLKAGETRHGNAINIPSGESVGQSVIFKVTATDATGRRIAANLDVPRPPLADN